MDGVLYDDKGNLLGIIPERKHINVTAAYINSDGTLWIEADLGADELETIKRTLIAGNGLWCRLFYKE